MITANVGYILPSCSVERSVLPSY